VGIDITDLLKDVNPTARRWVRALIGFGLSGAVGGFGLALQQVILPELEAAVGEEIYKLLYSLVLASLVATIAAGGKWLRENREVYLPF